MLPFAIVYMILFIVFAFLGEEVAAAACLIIAWVCLAAHDIIKEIRRGRAS